MGWALAGESRWSEQCLLWRANKARGLLELACSGYILICGVLMHFQVCKVGLAVAASLYTASRGRELLSFVVSWLLAGGRRICSGGAPGLLCIDNVYQCSRGESGLAESYGNGPRDHVYDSNDAHAKTRANMWHMEMGHGTREMQMTRLGRAILSMKFCPLCS